MPRTAALLLLCASAAVAADPPATPSDDSPAKNIAENARDKADMAREWPTRPHHPAGPIGRLIAFDLDAGFVRVRSAETSPPAKFVVDAAGWPGFLEIDADRWPDFYTLKHVGFTPDNSGQTITHVELTPGRIQIGRDTESATLVRNVSLIQTRGDDDGPVKLYVQTTSSGSQVKAVDFTLTAATFTELCRQHPDEVRDYLLPVLADLNARRLADTSDVPAAWQVLGDRVPPDPKLTAELDRLIKALDADAFAARAKAEEDLAALGPAAAAALRQRDLAKLPPDPRSSVEAAVRKNEPLAPELARTLGRSVPFLIDTLLVDEPKLVKAAGERLKELTGKSPPEVSPTEPMAEREKRVEAYRDAAGPTTRP